MAEDIQHISERRSKSKKTKNRLNNVLMVDGFVEVKRRFGVGILNRAPMVSKESNYKSHSTGVNKEKPPLSSDVIVAGLLTS